MNEEELDPVRARMRTVRWVPREQRAQRDMGGAMDVDEKTGSWTSGTRTPRSGGRYRPASIPAPDSPTLSVRLLSPRRPPVGYPVKSSSGEKCEPSQASVVGRAQFVQLTWAQLNGRFPHRGFRRKGWEEVLKTRLASMDVAEANCTQKRSAEQDSAIYEDGKRARAPRKGAGGSGISTQSSATTKSDGGDGLQLPRTVGGQDAIGWETRARTREGGDGLGFFRAVVG